ncbi:MAG: OmpA family protein [Bacteroidota bacterium]
MKKISITCLLALICGLAFGQQATLEGYVFEENNRGYLNLVKVTILDQASGGVVQTVYSDLEGFFTAELSLNKNYMLRAEKDVFKAQEVSLSTSGLQAGAKVYTKIKMSRKPGYIFDVTMAEKRIKDEPVDAILGAQIEVYNNTKKQEELVLKNHPKPTFSITFERGNHYTVMIRKPGYFTKRMEAYVDIKDCILCFDGVGEVRPGVSDNLAHGHQMGTLIANVELQKLALNSSMAVDKIYYNYNSASIKKEAETELDKIVTLLKDNPDLVVELGSHTDSRGSNPYNLKLSQQRAESAVDYITGVGLIDASRIRAKGYGETQLTNKCRDGVKCSDAQHAVNRRTELKVVGFLPGNRAEKSLAELIQEEAFERLLAEVQNGEEIRVEAGAEMPDAIKQQQLKQEAAAPPAEEKVALTTPAKTTAVDNTPPMQPEATPTAINTTTAAAPAPARSTTTPTTATTQRKKLESVSGSAGRRETATLSTPVPKPTKPTMLSESPRPKVSRSRIVSEYEITNRVSTRSPKPLPQGYNGYRVEFYASAFELPASHEIFSQHGNITIEEKKDGTYAYLLGSFADVRDAEQFLKNVMIVRYPRAKVVHYQYGNRLLK